MKTKSVMQRMLLLVVTLMCATLVNATDFESVNEDGVTIYYSTTSDNTVKVTKNRTDAVGYSGEVRIPESVNYQGSIYSVTEINDYCFYNCSLLTSVTLSSTITYIGNSAFAGCVLLESIELPQSIISIGESAFYDCTLLKSVVLPDQIKQLSYNMFHYCSSLQEITLPNSLITIENTALADCTSLTHITLPNSLKSIKETAFNGSTNLIEIVSEISNPFIIGSFTFVFQDKAILYVPAGTKSVYENMEGWKSISNIVEMETPEEGIEITLNADLQTFCPTVSMDFSAAYVPDAYIASGFNPTTGDVIMTRIDIVPAGVGVLLKGTAGKTYYVKEAETDCVYANLLKGVTAATQPTEGYLLVDGAFVEADGERVCNAGEAYLELPSESVTNIIDILTPQFTPNSDTFTLQGLKVNDAPTRKGIYIKDGKKFLIK